MKKYNYLEYRQYESHANFGRHTIFLEPWGPYYPRRVRWDLQIKGSPVWFTGFKTKFEALLFASHKLGYSMKKCNWTPI